MAEQFAELLGKRGKIYVNTTNPDVSSVEGRVKGFLAGIAEFPNMEVVKVDYCLDVQELARPFGCVVVLENIGKKIEFEEKFSGGKTLVPLDAFRRSRHEINNPLGSIMTNAQNLIEEETDAEKRVPLRWIEQETRRIAAIVRNLLEFSSPHPREQSGADVNQVISETLR